MRKIMALWIVMLMVSLPVSALQNDVTVRVGIPDDILPLAKRQVYGWINLSTGGPVSNSQVYFEDQEGSGASNSTNTDATGYYSLDIEVAHDNHHFVVYGINNTCLLNMTDWWLPDSVFHLDIEMDPAPPRNCSIHGYLHDAVTGLAIQYENVTALSEPENYMNITLTNDTGYYNMSLIPERYGMGVDIDGYESKSLNLKLNNGFHIWRNISLEPLTCQIRGYINDTTGTPINGALVEVTEPWNIDSWQSDYKSNTNAAGYYEFNLTRGTKPARVWATHWSHSCAVEMITGSVTWLNVTLPSSPVGECTIQGYITDFNTTNPINGADVSIGNLNHTWNDYTTSDVTGYYQILAPAWNLSVSAGDWEHDYNGTEVNCLAGQIIWQNITLTNQSEWATVQGNVTLDGEIPDWADILVKGYRRNLNRNYGTDGSGAYSFNISAGYVELRCRSQNSNIETVKMILQPDEVVWFDFDLYTLAFDSIILGTVTDGGGNPIQNALLYFSNSFDSNFGTFQTGALTDLNGTYEVAAPRGYIGFAVITDGYNIESEARDIDKEWNWHNFTMTTPLPSEVRVRGYIRDLDLMPIPGYSMTAALDDQEERGWTNWLSLSMSNWSSSNITGYYEFLAPKGRVDLHARDILGYYAPGNLHLDTRDGSDAWCNLTVRPKPRYCVVRGRAWQEDNTPIAGVKVTGTMGSRVFTVFTDAGGNYTFDAPAGDLRLTARKNEYGYDENNGIRLDTYEAGKIHWVNFTLSNYPADAWMQLPFTNSTSDLDGDGKYDWLYVDVPVNVTSEGEYYIRGMLKSSKWDDDWGSVSVEAMNNTNLPTGLTQVRLGFYGPTIYLTEINGYYLEVELYDDNWNTLDKRGQQVSSYSWTDFDAPDIEITDPIHTYCAIDTDFDGLYNMLQFKTTVNVLAPGNYTFMAQLFNIPGNNPYDYNEIEMVFETKELGVGVTTLSFSFSGTGIYNSGKHLGFASFLIINGTTIGEDSDFIGMSQMYVPYNYTEFQHYPIDSLVYGWVNDSTSTTPIENITVEIYNTACKYYNQTLTNDTGYYELGGWEGEWLLAMDDIGDGGVEVDGEYQGNLTVIALNSTTPIKENRNLQNATLDRIIANFFFDENDWNNFTFDQMMYVDNDNETLRYYLDVHEFGNGDGFFSEAEVDILLEYVGSQVQMPANLSDYITVDNITYDLDAGSQIFDLGFVGPVTSQNPVYIHQKANYTANASIPASSPHDLKLNVSYDDTFMGSITVGGNSTMMCYVVPPTGWGRTGNKSTPNVTISGSDYITVDPGPDPDPFDGNITEWVNITISDSVAPTTGSVAGNVTLAGRSRHDGVTVKVLNITTGAEVSRGVTDQYGSYYIPGIANGTYNITAEKGGYVPNITIDQVVTAGETTWVPDITLYSYPPVIFNVQYQSVVMNDTETYIYADVTDDGEVGNVTLQYKNVSGSNFFIQMDNIGQNTYQATIPAQVDTGLVEFNITANDTVGNSVTTGTYNITISGGVLPASYDIDLTGFSVGDWAFISFPITASGDVETVFNDTAWGDGGTQWDYIQWYDANDHTDHWKTYATFKPASLNDMPSVTNKMGFWIHLTANDGDKKLTIGEGYEDASTSINLYAGWNLVGYPTMNLTTTTSNAFWGIPVDKVEVFDPAEPYRIREVGPDYVMNPGEGYWVHVPVDTVWVVDW